jgi:hypothetical protein
MITLENTRFFSVRTGDVPDWKVQPFADSCAKFNLPITFLGRFDSWVSGAVNKVVNVSPFLYDAKFEGIKYVMFLDCLDLVMTQSAEYLLQKLNDYYEQGKILFPPEWSWHCFPIPELREHLQVIGKHVMCSGYFGDIDSMLRLYNAMTTPLIFIDQFRSLPIHSSKVFYWMRHCDQFLLHAALLRYPEIEVQIDHERKVFSWIANIKKPVLRPNPDGITVPEPLTIETLRTIPATIAENFSLGDAVFLHASPTQKKDNQFWIDWCKENILDR